MVLAFAFIAFEEPDRGRFDIPQSVMNNREEQSVKSGSQANGAYDISEDS